MFGWLREARKAAEPAPAFVPLGGRAGSAGGVHPEEAPPNRRPAERLDVIPATFRALVIRRPKYGCRACEEVVVQAPAPTRLIEGGLPTEATIAHVVFAKYADYTPLTVSF